MNESEVVLVNGRTVVVFLEPGNKGGAASAIRMAMRVAAKIQAPQGVLLVSMEEPQAPRSQVPKSFDSELDFARWLNEEQPDGHWGWSDVGNLVCDVDCIAIATQRPVHVEQMDALARYFFEGPFAGEYYGTECLDEQGGWGRLFLLSTDTTKSRHDDWTDTISKLWSHLQEGSPIRKTQRAGLGTKGTRAVEGLKCGIWAAFR